MADTWRVRGTLETVEIPVAGEELAAREHALDALERWKSGERADTRGVLRKHPLLRRDKSMVMELACEEFIQRRAKGEAVNAAEFSRQFPWMRNDLLTRIMAQSFLDRTGVVDDYDPPPWPEIGAEFLGFQLQDDLGQGAFAQVYLATEPALGDRPVALKVGRHGLREAERLAKLRHPNVVPVYRVEHDPQTMLTAVCMPYLGRATLSDAIDFANGQNPYPARAQVFLDAAQFQDRLDPAAETADPWLARGTYLDGVLRIGQQLAAALHFTHQAGIYHLDLKPPNVLLTPGGRPMLLDFNLAQEQDTNVTRMGGTLPYMSPEQIRASVLRDAKSPVDHRSDVYSLGVMLYEMVCGVRPFEPPPWKPSLAKMGELQLEQQWRGVRPLAGRYPLADAASCRLIERCLSFDPAERPQTAAELAAALESQLGPLPRTRRWMLGHRRLVYSSVLFAAALGGALAAYASTLDPSWVRHYHAGQQAYAAGQFEQALLNLNTSIASQPDQPDGVILRAKAHQKLGNYELAAADYARACLRVADPVLRAKQAFCWSASRSYPNALIAHQQAQEGGFENAQFLCNWGMTHYFCGNYDEAESALTRALELDSEMGIAYLGRAATRLAQSTKTGAPLPGSTITDVEEACARLRHDKDVLGIAARAYSKSAARNLAHRERSILRLQQATLLGFDPSAYPTDFPHLIATPASKATVRSDASPSIQWFTDPAPDR